jgi:hypothetical protein
MELHIAEFGDMHILSSGDRCLTESVIEQIMCISGKDRKAYRITVSESSGKHSLGPKFRIFENEHKKLIVGKRNKYGI